MDKFNKAFRDNFYLTKEYANFCSRTSGVPLERKTIGNQDIFVLGYRYKQPQNPMFNEEKVKRDLKRMKEAYEKALKKLEDIEARQEKIAQVIYKARKTNGNKE